jgi:hypothetical protein
MVMLDMPGMYAYNQSKLATEYCECSYSLRAQVAGYIVACGSMGFPPQKPAVLSCF